MTSGQKAAVSLLATFAVFAGFVAVAFTGLFSVIDTRFYEPAKIEGIRKQLDSVADASDTYFSELLKKFGYDEGAYLSNPAVISYFDSTPSEEDIRARSLATGNLFVSTQGLVGIRVIESNGRNIHFSTYTNDILRETRDLRMYKDYADVSTPLGNPELPFARVSAPDSRTTNAEKYVITYDGENSRIIFAFPFYDRYSVYRGSILFYVNSFDFNKMLAAQNIVPINNTCTLISSDVNSLSDDNSLSGFVFGLPATGNDLLQQEILRTWLANSTGPDKIVNLNEVETDEGKLFKRAERYWVLLTSSKIFYTRIAGVYRDTDFTMAREVQILILVCVFITLFLIVFMVFSLRQDDMVVIRDRIKRFQYAMLHEYFDSRENADWKEMARQISGRKQEVSARIKKSLGKRAKKHKDETEALISKSWDEIILALGGADKRKNDERFSSTDAAEIKKMLEEILSSGNIKVQAVSTVASTAVVSKETVVQDETVAVAKQQVEKVEETPSAIDESDIDEIEDADGIEELEDVEDIEDVEAVEELAEVEDDDIEELEDLDDEDIEDLEEVPLELDSDTGELDGEDSSSGGTENLEIEDVSEVELLGEVPLELGGDTGELDGEDSSSGGTENLEIEDVSEAELLAEVPLELDANDDKSLEELEDTNEANDVEDIDGAEPVEDVPEVVPVDDSLEEAPEKILEIDEDDDAELLEDIDEVEDVVDEQTEDTSDAAASKSDETVPPEIEIIEAEDTSSVEDYIDERFDFGTHYTYSSDAESDAEVEPVFTITPVAPDFSLLDELPPGKNISSDILDEALPGENISDDVPDVEPVSNDIWNFSLMKFDTKSEIDGDLPLYEPNVIVESEDGIFKIADDLIYTDVQQDKNFQELVESVLK